MPYFSCAISIFNSFCGFPSRKASFLYSQARYHAEWHLAYCLCRPTYQKVALAEREVWICPAFANFTACTKAAPSAYRPYFIHYGFDDCVFDLLFADGFFVTDVPFLCIRALVMINGAFLPLPLSPIFIALYLPQKRRVVGKYSSSALCACSGQCVSALSQTGLYHNVSEAVSPIYFLLESILRTLL